MSLNLGQVAGLFVGTSAPNNKALIWWDSTPSQMFHKVYNNKTNLWEALDKFAIRQITYTELVNLAVTGLTIGSYYRISDKSNVLAISITQTKVQYADSAGNIVIDDLGNNQEYITSSTNLIIDDINGVFDVETKRVVFAFAEQNSNDLLGDDYVLLKGVRVGVVKFLKVKFSNLISSVTDNSISWNKGFFFNFIGSINNIKDKNSGIVSYDKYKTDIQTLGSNIQTIADNQSAFIQSAKQTINQGFSPDNLYSKQLPSNLSTGAPSDIAKNDSLLTIINKIQKWIVSFKTADGIKLTQGFKEGEATSLNNNDTTDSAFRKVAAWITKFKTADGIKLTSDFTPAVADSDLAANDTVNVALSKTQRWIAKFKRANGIQVSADYSPYTQVVAITNADSVDVALRKLNGALNLLNLAPIGSSFAFFGLKIPSGWLLCDGSTYLAEDYPELYAVLGGKLSPFNINVPSTTTHFRVPTIPVYGTPVQNDRLIKSLVVVTPGSGYNPQYNLSGFTLSNGAMCKASAFDSNWGITGFDIVTKGSPVNQNDILTVTATQTGMGVGATFRANILEYGGEKTHKLTIAEMPKHSHDFETGGDGAIDNYTSGVPLGRQNFDSRESTTTTTEVGGDGYHNNMQPYVTSFWIIRAK